MSAALIAVADGTCRMRQPGGRVAATVLGGRERVLRQTAGGGQLQSRRFVTRWSVTRTIGFGGAGKIRFLGAGMSGVAD